MVFFCAILGLVATALSNDYRLAGDALQARMCLTDAGVALAVAVGWKLFA